MTGNNAFFKQGDQTAFVIDGYELSPDWWSRHYEYIWALQYAEPDHVCADMGCGWHDRPMKDVLSNRCGFVYAVDAHPDVKLLAGHENMQYVVADITKDTGITAASLDRVYCISVLEDLGELVRGALKEFARVLKQDGRVIITCDSHYDISKPLGKYPGVNMDHFIDAVKDAGLEFDGVLDFDKTDAIFHNNFNLCCWHCVLRKA